MHKEEGDEEEEEESEQQSILDELARDSSAIAEKEKVKASAVRQHRAVIMLDSASAFGAATGARSATRSAPRQTDKEIISKLHKLALTWDFHGIEPHDERLQRIPTSFENSEEYISVFRPLLLRELDAQIQQGKLEGDEAVCYHVTRQDIGSEGDFTLVSFSVHENIRELPWAIDDLLFTLSARSKSSPPPRPASKAASCSVSFLAHEWQRLMCRTHRVCALSRGSCQRANSNGPRGKCRTWRR
jgi:hypothetical protein